MSTFIDLVNLASARLNAKVLLANDEFFAPKENLLKPEDPIFIPHKYTSRGKWMDGWETRRRRTSGHDWCIIQLAFPGIIHGIDVETTHFIGNYPEHCSIEATSFNKGKISKTQLKGKTFQTKLSGNMPFSNNVPCADNITCPDNIHLPGNTPLPDNTFWPDNLPWMELLPKSPLQGDTHNYFPIQNHIRQNHTCWTHLRLNIYPDGGVARLRVYGTVVPNWSIIPHDKLFDLAAIQYGGRVVSCSDMTFSSKNNIILPGRPRNMGDGWETKRRRGPGHDWILVKLGAPGVIQQVEVDTTYFKGNAPGECSLEGITLKGSALRSTQEGDTFQKEIDLDQGLVLDFELQLRDLEAIEKLDRVELLPKTPLKPDHLHLFTKIQTAPACSHVLLRIYPDGGVARLRIYGIRDHEH